MALTDQKRRYAAARLAGAPKKQAAIEAGCPERSASQAASRLEKDPDVQAAMGRMVAVEQKRKDEPPIDPNPHIPAQAGDPLEFMRSMMNDLEAEPKLRLDAAKALASFTVTKPGEQGKKEQKATAAQAAAKGRFAQSAPPRMVVDNTRK